MVDTHCHLLLEEYKTLEHLQEIVSHMNGNLMITSATNRKNIQETLEIVKKFPNVYGVIGIHPEEIDDGTEENLNFLESHLFDEKIVGIGEIGLDYHYTKENREQQIKLFEKQLQLAKKYQLPCVIHSRDALEDTYHILKDVIDGSFPVILHCYGYSVEMAKEFLKLGVFFGIGGVVTFKKSLDVQEAAQKLPLDKILVETDAPYLAPVPKRGRENRTAYTRYVVDKIAELRGLSVEEVAQATTENAKRLFDCD